MSVPDEAAEAARQDPSGTVASYIESHGKLSREHRWRELVTFRCGKRHFLGWVIVTPGGLVLYAHRSAKEWKGLTPMAEATLLEGRDSEPSDWLVPLGSCSCGKLKTRELAWVWDRIDEARSTKKGRVVEV